MHLYGFPAAMDAILDIAQRHKIVVVEDACQAHGAEYARKKVGSLGAVGCFSFYPSKNLGAFGEGGAITTSDTRLVERIKALRHHAQFEKNVHAEIGYNYRLDCLQAAVLRVKLKHLDACNDSRRALADRYRSNLEGTDYRLPVEGPHCRHIYHLFTIGCTDKEATGKALSDAGIGWGEHYPIPVHLQPAFSHIGMSEGSYPVAEKQMRELISLDGE